MKFGNYLVSGRSITILSGVFLSGVCLFGLRGDVNSSIQDSTPLEKTFFETSYSKRKIFLRDHFYESLKSKSEDLVGRIGDVVRTVERNVERNFTNETISNYKKNENYDSLKIFLGGTYGKD